MININEFLQKKKGDGKPGSKYNFVDLGLPSGIKWADRNLGADSPTKIGNYYAWGVTETFDDNNKFSMKYYENHYT